MRISRLIKAPYHALGITWSAIIFGLFAASAHAFGPSWTDNPPDYKEGIGIFGDTPTQEDCRNCHYDLNRFPQLGTSNPNRHHRLVNKPILGLANGSQPTRAPGDTSKGIYTCLTCHELARGSRGYFELKPFRDCLRCHIKESVTGSPQAGTNVHHFTKTFGE